MSDRWGWFAKKAQNARIGTHTGIFLEHIKNLELKQVAIVLAYATNYRVSKGAELVPPELVYSLNHLPENTQRDIYSELEGQMLSLFKVFEKTRPKYKTFKENKNVPSLVDGHRVWLVTMAANLHPNSRPHAEYLWGKLSSSFPMLLALYDDSDFIRYYPPGERELIPAFLEEAIKIPEYIK